MASALLNKAKQELLRERDHHMHKSPGALKRRDSDDPIDWLVQAAAAGVGFVSEVYRYRQDKKAAMRDVEATNATEDRDTPTPDTDNEEKPAAKPKKDPIGLAQEFIDRHPVSASLPETRLSLPVIIPQRRPKTRARGFMRVHAPILADKGIREDTFLDFVDTFNTSLVPNPYIFAINLAGFAGLAYPEPIMMLLDATLGLAVDAAMEAQSRFRSNTFLDRANAGFFRPRGLICLVVTYRPDAVGEGLITGVDFDGNAVAMGPEAGEGSSQQVTAAEVTNKVWTPEGLKERKAKMERLLKFSNGTFSTLELAPLLYVPAEQTASATRTLKDGKKTKNKNAFDRAEVWLDDYMDRRSQAEWIEQNPALPMAQQIPRPEFRSKFADPSHIAANGDIVSLITGGKFQSGSEKEARRRVAREQARLEKRERRAEEKAERERSKQKGRASDEIEWKRTAEKQSIEGLLSGLFQKDVLYLMIVNLPKKDSLDPSPGPVDLSSE